MNETRRPQPYPPPVYEDRIMEIWLATEPKNALDAALCWLSNHAFLEAALIITAAILLSVPLLWAIL